jgi:predicted aconitase with swiveling domain
MKAASSSQDLLYIADQTTQEVYTYTYPQGQLVGTLTGFINPTGECVDSSGDVFIVSQASASPNSSKVVYEYAHGGTSPIAVLDDPSRGQGCAIDPSSGNLAVAGAYSSGQHSYGAVAIFKKARGNASMLYSKTFQPFWFCGYDSKANLYISGNSGTPDEQQLTRLAKGANKFEQIKLNSQLYGNSTFPSSVQWDGKYMTASSANTNIGDGHYQPSYIYRLTISGSAATTIGTTTFTGRRKLMTGQIWIDGKRLIASYYHRTGGVDSWSYPNAKGSRVVVPISTHLIPFGIAVSSTSH